MKICDRQTRHGSDCHRELLGAVACKGDCQPLPHPDGCITLLGTLTQPFVMAHKDLQVPKLHVKVGNR